MRGYFYFVVLGFLSLSFDAGAVQGSKNVRSNTTCARNLGLEPVDTSRWSCDPLIGDLVVRYLSDHESSYSASINYVMRNSTIVLWENNSLLGWSAEYKDDYSFYRYPDRSFYHKDRNPKGTIKVNYNPKMFLAMVGTAMVKEGLNAVQARISQAEIEETEKFLAGASAVINGIVALETIHAYQYHLKPVKFIGSQLKKNPSLMRNGLIDRSLLREAKEGKLTNERAAVLLERSYYKSNLESIRFAFAMKNKLAAPIVKYIEQKYSKRVSDIALARSFALIGSILSDVDAYSWYLDLTAFQFTPAEANWYQGQFEPAEFAWEIRELNDFLAALDKSERKVWGELLIPNLGLSYQWQESEALLPYLPAVYDRIQRECGRLSDLIGFDATGALGKKCDRKP